MLAINGLSRDDVNAYYGGAVLACPSGLFRVDSYSDGRMRGNILDVSDGWRPHNYSPADLSIIFPKEGYITYQKGVCQVIQTIRRSRRKGYNSESYAIRTTSPNTAPRGVDVYGSSVLPAVFNETRRLKEFPEALKAVRGKSNGYALSKDIALSKLYTGDTVLLVRGQVVGILSTKKDVIFVPPKHEVFLSELSEYNIPIEVVDATKNSNRNKS
jgi:hypothetical protein